MISVKTWKDDAVKRTFWKDSSDFKAITKALENYHSPTAAGTQQAKLQALSDALDRWVQAKGGGNVWSNTSRNQRGAVQTLFDDIQNERTRNTTPNLAGPYVAPNQLGLIQAAALARKNRVDANFYDVDTSVTQDLDYRDGSGNQHFAWDVRLKLTERPFQLEVKVPIIMNGGNSKVKSDWRTHIESVWNNAQFRLPSGDILHLVFILEWSPTGTAGAFTVDVTNPLGIPPKKEYVKTTVGGQSTWVKQGNSDRLNDGSTMGTPNMNEWGANDKSAISHEFGHMIGNPDEYYTRKYNNTNTDANIYDQEPFTTDSIMNDTSKAKVYPRHYYLIREQYAAWKGISANSIEVIV